MVLTSNWNFLLFFAWKVQPILDRFDVDFCKDTTLAFKFEFWVALCTPLILQWCHGLSTCLSIPRHYTAGAWHISNLSPHVCTFSAQFKSKTSCWQKEYNQTRGRRGKKERLSPGGRIDISFNSVPEKKKSWKRIPERERIGFFIRWERLPDA